MSSKLRKLIAMGPREILFRARHALALRRERRQFRAGEFAWNDAAWCARLAAHFESTTANSAEPTPTPDNLAETWQRHMVERNEPPFLLDEATLEPSVALYQRLFADRLERVPQSAEAAVAGRFAFLGIETDQGAAVEWHTDPKSGYPWQQHTFHADLDFSFCREGGGDVKYVWELNRQEPLIDCAKAFRLFSAAGDAEADPARFRDHVTNTVESWTRANPYLDGINWASALEVAIRSFCWLWAYQFCRPFDRMSPEAHLNWIKAFYHHGHFLHRHLSYYFSPNNHLIGEAAALYLLGCFFPEFDEAQQWREHGWSAIEEHYRHQYYDDGGSTEQATFYHNYCLGFLLLAVLTRQRRGEPVPPPMLDRVEKALEFTMWMTRGDGSVPRIGDVDNARSIRFEEPPLWDFRNLLSIGAVMFSRSDMKAAAGYFSEDALWLLGAKGYDRYEQLAATAPRETSRAFPHSGYYIMRSGWDRDDHHLVFDAGPIASGLFPNDTPSSCHGHSDMLSFVLHAFGEPLIVDGGFYTYDEDPLWHRYFREASAHNTLLVDGASHAKFYASNAWSCVAVPEPLRIESTAESESVQSGHNGYYGVTPPVRHQRSIEWDRQDHFIVRDRVEGSGSHQIEVFFHLAPGVKIAKRSPESITIKTMAGRLATVEVLDNEQTKAEVVEGGEGPDGGWVGTGYGHRQRAPVLKFSGQVELPASFSFSIHCSRSQANRASDHGQSVTSDDANQLES